MNSFRSEIIARKQTITELFLTGKGLMKFLFASDTFKGSLTSEQTAFLLEKAAKTVFENCECRSVQVADGGEGTVDAVIAAENGRIAEAQVHDPLMHPITACYGVIRESKAVIEMAAASGLPLVPEHLRNPMNTTSFGTGELILHALDSGYRDISIAIGGSATNDGGMGCMRALGVRFFDKNDNELQGFGRDLIHISKMDISGIDKRLNECRLTVMCDVKNPLCGEHGATNTFAEQKGATEDIKRQLENGMTHYRDMIKYELGIDCDAIEGAGAAGGLGAALKVFCNGEMKSGIETVLELIRFDSRLDGVDLVITGEGRTDRQSCFGKVMSGVGTHAKAKGIPVIGLCGSLGEGAMDICHFGVNSLMTTVNAPMTLNDALTNAVPLYYEAAVRLFRIVKVGMQLQNPN